jgi:hypothetical protein
MQHCSLGRHRSLITDRWSLITNHGSLVTDHGSLITGHCSLITGHCSLITGHCSLLTNHFPRHSPASAALRISSSARTRATTSLFSIVSEGSNRM